MASRASDWKTICLAMSGFAPRGGTGTRVGPRPGRVRRANARRVPGGKGLPDGVPREVGGRPRCLFGSCAGPPCVALSSWQRPCRREPGAHDAPMLLALLVAALPFPAPQQESRPRLQLEDLEGRTSELQAGDLPLSDPRQKGAWIVRPLDYPPGKEGPSESGLRARVTLVNGDELHARVRGGSGEVLALELVGGVVVPFDLAVLRSLEFPENVPAEQRLSIRPASEGDRLYRRAGELDAIDGTLEGFEAEGVRFDSVLGSRTIPWSEVGALFIETLEAVEERPAQGRVPVVVAFAGPDGGRVRGELLAIEREHCRVVLGGKTEVQLPLFAVRELVVADGRLTYLSDLVPARELGRGAPFGDELGMLWPHRMDRNVLGGALRAGGVEYRRGIGMHA